jgi:transcription antitermination factor NusG
MDRIARLDLHHRRALVKITLAGEERLVKFGLWTDADPKLDSIEKEKQSRREQRLKTEFKAGDRVLNTKGLFGDTPVEVKEVHPGRRSLTVRVLLFGRETDIEMDMEDVIISESKDARQSH